MVRLNQHERNEEENVLPNKIKERKKQKTGKEIKSSSNLGIHADSGDGKQRVKKKKRKERI